MIAILFLVGLVVAVAIAWANRLERTLPGIHVIGADVPVPRATARQLRWRRRRLARERRAHNPSLRSL